jgi:tetratricopeptide (TPR) repeat protein
MSSWVRRIQRDLDGAMTASREALEIAATLGDPALQADASHRLGQAYFSLGDFGRAAELLRGNVAAIERGTPGPVRFMGIFSQAWLARVLSALGEFTEGRRHGEAALRLALVEKRRELPIAAHGCLGLLYLAKGDLEAAIRVLEPGLALGRAAGGRDWSRDIAGGLGEAYAQAGRLAEGLALLEEARRDDVRTGALVSYPTRFRQLSAVYLLAGRFDEASQQVYQALDLARQQQARGEEAHVLFQLGAVHAHASPPDVQQAEARYREALMRAEALGMRPLQAHCQHGLGTLYAKTGRQEQARAALATAIALYRAMEMTFWLPQAEAVLAEVEGH